MAATRCLLAMIVLAFSYPYASGATGSIGTVSARGDIRVDGYTVWGNGTLFDGTKIETGQATATLRLDSGTEIELATNSQGVVYRDHLVLLQGRSQLKTLDAPFLLEAGGLRVAPSGPDALGVVSMSPANTVRVAAVTGDFRVVDGVSLSVAHVSHGAAISFPAAQSAGTPSGSSFIGVTGLVSEENGIFYLTTDHGVKYQLVTGEELKKFAGKTVTVSGFLQAAATPSGTTQVLVTSIEINGAKSTGMTTQTKALIGVGIGGGAAAAAIVAAESGKSSASR
jgi:Protein of unknown function (DUF5818)